MLILEIFFKDMNLYTASLTLIFFIILLVYIIIKKISKKKKKENFIENA